MSRLILAVFSSLTVLALHAAEAWAAEPELIAEPYFVGVGQQFTVTLRGVQTDATVDWSVTEHVTRMPGGAKATVATLRGASTGTALITARTSDREFMVAVLVIADPQKALRGMTVQQERILSLLAKARAESAWAPDAAAQGFFRDLSRLELKNPMVVLNDTKRLLNERGLADDCLGPKSPGGATEVESLLLGYRRDVTLEAIRRSIADVSRQFPPGDLGKVYLVKIGKWANQSPNEFTFAGDIDFTYLTSVREVGLALRDAFDRAIFECTGLTMAQLDSLATAHGDAAHYVYVGPQGKKYGDDAMMEMTKGEMTKGEVEPVDFQRPNAIGREGTQRVSGKEALQQVLLDQLARGPADRPQPHNSGARRAVRKALGGDAQPDG